MTDVARALVQEVSPHIVGSIAIADMHFLLQKPACTDVVVNLV